MFEVEEGYSKLKIRYGFVARPNSERFEINFLVKANNKIVLPQQTIKMENSLQTKEMDIPKDTTGIVIEYEKSGFGTSGRELVVLDAELIK